MPPLNSRAAGVHAAARAASLGRSQRDPQLVDGSGGLLLSGFARQPLACAEVAQLVEHSTENAGVTGSIPVLGTNLRSRLPIECVSFGWRAWLTLVLTTA